MYGIFLWSSNPGEFFRTLYVGVAVLGTVNSIFVLKLNCRVVNKS